MRTPHLTAVNIRSLNEHSTYDIAGQCHGNGLAVTKFYVSRKPSAKEETEGLDYKKGVVLS